MSTAAPEPPYLLVDACSYCYGAAGTTSAVLDRLAAEIPCVLVAKGSSLELLRAHRRLDHVVECDTEDWRELCRIAPLVERASLAFVNTNPVMTVFARARGVPVVYLDIIPWLNATVAEQTSALESLFDNADGFASLDARALFAGAERFLLQTYLVPFDHDPSIAAPKLVGPLLHSTLVGGRAPAQRENRLLVSVGGLFNPDTPPEDLVPYVRDVANTACETAAEYGIADVWLAGPPRLRAIVRERSGPPRLTVRHLAHGRFVELLLRSEFAAVAPGLTSIFECFAAAVPTLLLPATNLSQMRQVAAVRACGLDGELDAGRALAARYASLAAETDEIVATRRIGAALREAAADGSLPDALRAGFATLLSSQDGDELHARRHRYVRSLGGDGAADTAAEIGRVWGAAAAWGELSPRSRSGRGRTQNA